MCACNVRVRVPGAQGSELRRRCLVHAFPIRQRVCDRERVCGMRGGIGIRIQGDILRGTVAGRACARCARAAVGFLAGLCRFVGRRLLPNRPLPASSAAIGCCQHALESSALVQRIPSSTCITSRTHVPAAVHTPGTLSKLSDKGECAGRRDRKPEQAASCPNRQARLAGGGRVNRGASAVDL